MQAIHKIVKITDNQVIINLPIDFIANEAEVIVKPFVQKNTGIYDLEKEIDLGMKSPASPRSHKEVFDNLRKKYESG